MQISFHSSPAQQYLNSFYYISDIKTKTHEKFLLLTVLNLSLFAVTTAERVDTIPPPAGATYTQIKMRSSDGVLDASGNLWVAFPNWGVGKYDGTNWTIDSTSVPRNAWAVELSLLGIWVGTNNGLYEYDGVTWQNFKSPAIPNDTVRYLYSSAGNDAWIYGYGFKGVAHFNTGSSVIYNKSNGLADDSVTCIFKTSSGQIWVGTPHGLSAFNAGNWINYTKSNSTLTDDAVTSLAEDGNGYLFVGTYSGKLYVDSAGIFIQYTPPSCEKFPKSYKQPIYNLVRMNDGSIVVMDGIFDFYYTNPTRIVQHTSAKTSTSFYYYAKGIYGISYIHDSQDRIYRVGTINSSNVIQRLDSINSMPVTLKNLERNDYKYLNINEVSAGMSNDNALFTDHYSATFEDYEVPNGCYRKANSLSTLWIGGYSSTGTSKELRVAAQTYRQPFTTSDFWPGPVNVGGTVDSATVIAYDSIWKLDRRTVDEFITQYNLGNVTNGSYTIPVTIQSWPGNHPRGGKLAPFVDRDGDSIYNPLKGDYPKIKGDQMLWWVMNDVKAHSGSGSPYPIGVEVQCSAYAYSCNNISPSDSAINWTTFYTYKIINRNDTLRLDSTFIGIFDDFSLGNFLNDRVGCRVPNNYVFVYNTDNHDDPPTGYDENPPMLSLALLNGPQADAGDLLDNDNDGSTDEPGEQCMLNHFISFNNDNTFMGNPTISFHYYNYMMGRWKNGATAPTYMYPGIPFGSGAVDTSFGDRRVVLSMGPFSFLPGQEEIVDFAVVFTWYSTAPNGLNTSIARNHDDVMKVKHWFETDSFPCNNSYIGVNEIPHDPLAFTIYPNPAKQQCVITVGRFSRDLKLEMTNALGQVVYTQKLSAPQLFVDLQPYAKGVYFISLKDNASVSTKKLLID